MNIFPYFFYFVGTLQDRKDLGLSQVLTTEEQWYHFA